MFGRRLGVALASAALAVLALSVPAHAAVEPLVLPDGPNAMIKGPAYKKSPKAHRALPVMYAVKGSVNERTNKVTLVYRMKDVMAPKPRFRQMVTFQGVVGDKSILVSADSNLGPAFTVSDGDTSQGTCYKPSTGKSKMTQSFRPAKDRIVVTFPLRCVPAGKTITEVYASSQATAVRLGPKKARGIIGSDFSDTTEKPSWVIR